ncbi:DNA topoisomerase, partial [Escherichia coli]|uniref:DNA topoisomerase n=1 Tax=Escherichia coli TaxID=562 RepID=UPI00256F41F3
FTKLYDLIWRRFVSCQMSASVYDETTIDVVEGVYMLRASGQILKFDGWRKVAPIKKGEDEVVALPNVEKG